MFFILVPESERNTVTSLEGLSSKSDTHSVAEQGQCKSAPTFELLQSWAVNNNITRNALSDLLKILKTHHCFKSYPSDARTLLNTSTSTSTLAIGNGEFIYIGVKIRILSSISNSRDQNTDCINLQFNIDSTTRFFQ